MNSQEYIEVSFRITPYSDENAEILMAELEDVPFESFTCEEPYLKGYIPKEKYNSGMVRLVLDGLDESFGVEFSSALIPPVNWNAVWEQQFSPIVVDNKCTIKAPFHKGLKRTRFNITIEPKMAFGTGHHQTTYMMCRALLDNEAAVKGKVVMDMGCGTAILAILAAKMGAAHTYGIDIDAVAAVSAFDNARINNWYSSLLCRTTIHLSQYVDHFSDNLYFTGNDSLKAAAKLYKATWEKRNADNWHVYDLSINSFRHMVLDDEDSLLAIQEISLLYEETYDTNLLKILESKSQLDIETKIRSIANEESKLQRPTPYSSF